AKVVPIKQLQSIRHVALDLDGTLYLGKRVFDFTRPFLDRLRQLGIGRTFVTNNSSRSTREYVAHLCAMGIDATADDILSSTTATVEYLRRQRPEVRRVFVLGTPGLRGEFAENQFTLIDDVPSDFEPGDEPDAVIVGFDTTLA